MPHNEQILLQEDRLLSAMQISDINDLDLLLHEDLLFITPDGRTITKAMDLDSHRSGAMVIEKIDRTIEQIHIINDNAVVTLVIDTKGKMLGEPFEGRYRYLRVWNRENGQWKVIAGSCTAA